MQFRNIRGRVAMSLLFACALTASTAARAQDRGSFTALLTLGYGLQSGALPNESGEGLSGLSFGIGGFVSHDFALMFRLSGSNVNYDLSSPLENVNYNVVSGVGVLDGRFWLNDRLNFEAGAGFGFSDIRRRRDGRHGPGALLRRRLLDPATREVQSPSGCRVRARLSRYANGSERGLQCGVPVLVATPSPPFPQP